ncbi:hypothetical protein G5V58_07295 [Nocardioides anomalus]|uniref:Uncharacterized protein n=1 Tax=Nocardioides anomalus TaxID=2712223 RepID=A0A6G6WB98_9ACTN|nr:hypothetical protein [Nocardioides anomalus]QIG42608.1 hypothetical protein G5V58_07295 [Nocardioides anomalus]
MSKERQQRRAVREAEQAAAASARAVEAERRARKDARKQRLTGWVPTQPSGRPTGVLAEKRSRELRVLVAVLIALNLLVFAFTRDWYVTGLTLVASVLGAPIVHMILFRKG